MIDMGEPWGKVDFKLSPEEKTAALAFIEKYRLPTEELGATAHQFSFTFTVGTIGNLVTITDRVTGEAASITDLDKF